MYFLALFTFFLLLPGDVSGSSLLLIQGLCNTTQLYDPLHPEQSRIIRDLPANFIPVALPATVSLNEKIYVIGGVNANDDATDHVQIIDFSENITRKAKPLLIGRYEHTANVIGSSQIIACGGWNGYGGIFDSCELYSTSYNTWSQSTPMPRPMYGHTSAVLGQTLYIIGGADDRHTYDSMFAWDTIKGGTWVEKQSMNTPRWASAALAMPGSNKILIAGGGYPIDHALHTSEEYDPSSDKWKMLNTTLGRARWGHSLVLVDSMILVIGGGNQQYVMPYVEVYNEDSSRFETLDPLPTLCAYWSSSGVLIDTLNKSESL